MKIFKQIALLILGVVVFGAVFVQNVQANGGVYGRVSVVDDNGTKYGVNGVGLTLREIDQDQSRAQDFTLNTLYSDGNLSYGQVRNDENQCVSVTVAVAPGNGYYHQPGGPGGDDNCYGGIQPYGLTCSDPNKTLRVSTIPGEGSGDVRWNGRPGYWTVNVRSVAGIAEGQSGIEYIGTCNQFSGDRKSQCENLCGSNPTCVLMGPHDNAWAGKIDYEYHLYTVRLNSVGASCNGTTAAVTLQWSANFDFAQYRLYRGDGDRKNVVQIATLPTQRVSTYTDTTAAPNTTYTYWVNAITSDGKQTWSNPPYDRPVSVATPPSCQADSPPKISLFAEEAQPGAELLPLVSYKPGKNGYNSFNSRRLKLVSDVIAEVKGDSMNPRTSTRVKMFVARTDGASMSDCPGTQSVTINVPANAGSSFAGKTVNACKIYDSVPGLDSPGEQYWIPNGVRDYYVWVEGVDPATNLGCTGAKQYYSNITYQTPVKVGGTDYYWCGPYSFQLVSTAQTQGAEVAGQSGSIQKGVYGVSGTGVEFYNPVQISPKINFSPYFETSSIAVSGVAFIDSNINVGPVIGYNYNVLYSLRDNTTNKKGFILLYANRDTELESPNGRSWGSLQAGNYYVIYNGNLYRLSRLPLDQLDLGDMRIELVTPSADNPQAKINSIKYLVTFQPQLGPKKWKVYDYIQNDLGAAEVQERTCDSSRGSCF